MFTPEQRAKNREAVAQRKLAQLQTVAASLDELAKDRHPHIRR
jgi:hypothetical protein